MLEESQYKEIDRALQAVLDVEPHDRVSFIDSFCSDDPALKDQVKHLLTSFESTWSLLEVDVFELAAPILADDSPVLKPGDSISHYRIEALIGKGGMGHVYLAEDGKLGRKVALKLLPPAYTSDQTKMHRLEREARAASALNHPGILTIHEFGEVDGQQYIATEFVDGETLRSRLENGPLDAAEAVRITTQIARALAAAHQAGIVHRDIKPENIMLRRDGFVKVLDFGLATLTDEVPAEPSGSRQGDQRSTPLMGTLRYMSPEQADGRSVDYRSDIFSLGVVLYEMVAGRPPFAGGTAQAGIRSVIEDTPPVIANAEVSPRLAEILAKSLCKDREHRYQTAEDMIADLTEHSLEPISARFQPERCLVWARAHYYLTAAIFGIALMLLGVGAYSLKSWVVASETGDTQWNSALLTTTGHAMDAVISRDGRYLAYRAEDAGLVSLRMRDLGSGNETQVSEPGLRFVFNPIFTPDGKYLYYEAIAVDPPPDYPGRGFPKNYWRELYRRPVAGGETEKILDYITSRVDFSSDGSRMAYFRLDLRQKIKALVTANLDGGQAVSIIEKRSPDQLSKDFYGDGPAWSPDGRHIAYAARNAADGYDRVFIVDLESKVERPLTSKRWDHGIEAITWLPDSSGIAFTASNTSMSNAIWRVSYPDGELQKITNDTGKYMGISITADSNKLVTSTMADHIDIWLAPDGDAARSRNVMPARHDSRYGLAWAPDGKIVFTRENAENSDIWTANSDGTDQRQVTTDTRADVWPGVSADGRYIIFQSGRSGSDQIWRMDIDGANQQQLTFGIINRSADISPDSRWVVTQDGKVANPAYGRSPSRAEHLRRSRASPAELRSSHTTAKWSPAHLIRACLSFHLRAA